MILSRKFIKVNDVIKNKKLKKLEVETDPSTSCVCRSTNTSQI